MGGLYYCLPEEEDGDRGKNKIKLQHLFGSFYTFSSDYGKRNECDRASRPGPKMFRGPLHCYYLRRVCIHLAPGPFWPTIHTFRLSNVLFWTNGHLSNKMKKPKWYSLSLHKLPTDGQSTYATVWSDPVSPATEASRCQTTARYTVLWKTQLQSLSLDWQ